MKTSGVNVARLNIITQPRRSSFIVRIAKALIRDSRQKGMLSM